MSEVQRPLQGLLVAETGGREAVGICGSLLAQLGATVVLVEPTHPAVAVRPRDTCRALHAAGKLSLAADDGSPEDRARVVRLIERCDVLLTSSDIDAPGTQVTGERPEAIVCDITAFGSSGPMTGHAAGEAQIQALAGLMDTTGPRDGPPLAIGVPVANHAAGVYGAAAVLAALRMKRRDGIGQHVEVALFDAAFVSLNAFLTGVLTGQVTDRTRIGNRHPTMAPWNLYATADGLALICTGSQAHWERLCALMGRPTLAADYPTQRARLDAIDAVDDRINAWTRTLSTADCVSRLLAIGVPSGPIAPIDRFPREANIQARGVVRELHDPVCGGMLALPGSPLGLLGSPPLQPTSIPAPGTDRAAVERLLEAAIEHSSAQQAGAARPQPGPASAAAFVAAPPLAGIRVVEVGQYTTAPFCTRNLAQLGADVIKIEKPSGDESRTYPPFHNGVAETYLFNNAGKRDLVLDLTRPEDVEALKALLRTADVLVENNKPGMLAKFGLTRAALQALNPRLVVCSISGFGAESLYADRPGFDTVIQAMSGFMTAVNPGGLPYKSGISAADVMGANVAIVAILGALEQRDRSGRGQCIDLSMQDIACWLTAPVWNGALTRQPRPAVLRCLDGYVAIDAGVQAGIASSLPPLAFAGLTAEAALLLTRAELAARLTQAGLPAAPVHTLNEAATWPQTRARRNWFHLREGGMDAPSLACPIRLQRAPLPDLRPAPALDQDRDDILRELGIDGAGAALERISMRR